jgi:hypothetical protein
MSTLPTMEGKMRTVTFEVELNMFAQGAIREVEVPAHELGTHNYIGDLDTIFKWGQNDFQPMELPSVSMGDVIRYYGERYLILSVGFRKLKEGDITVGFIPPAKE